MSERSRALRREAAVINQPRLSAIWLIYLREMRDQLRDRRTLFTIAVLPIMLYPLVGMLLMQIAQFSRQSKTAVCIVGTENLEQAPPLLEGELFAPHLLEQPESMELLTYRWDELDGAEEPIRTKAKNWIQDNAFDLVLLIPPGFASQAIAAPNNLTSAPEGELVEIELYHNVASDQSNVARERVADVLATWRSGWVRDRLEGAGIDPESLWPFEWAATDVAPERTREAAFWSKILPFIMLVWAMTGAFYPAIDLVAGEKERGTLETLLCSPALRSEIVWGKLGAVASFSMLTALLNAGSMLITSSLVFQHMDLGGPGMLGAPPLAPMMWLLVALVPLSMLFSALALAVAAMARSSKEGQYYLMPLMMVTLPLVMLPMVPGTTLNVGTSLIPVTGMFLLVRSLVEGQYMMALGYVPMVALVTGTCLWFASRWACRQFEDESVLFGGSEKWELSSWVRHLWRDRQVTATPAQGYACGAIILVTLFFARLTVTSMPETFAGIVRLVMMPQVLILFPALLMATMMTKSIRQGLRLHLPRWTTLPLGVLLGVTLHPTYVMLSKLVSHLYPLSEQTVAAMKPFSDQIASAPWFAVVLLMAALPAVCEELAFRGFIFGGLVRERGHVRAVVITALMFGISHGVLQQSITATVMGLILGWVTLRTGSVLPCLLIHFTNNALSVSLERIAGSSWEGAAFFLTQTEAGPVYQPLWTVVSMAIAMTCLLYFGTLEPRHGDADADQVDSRDRFVDPAGALVSA